MKYALFHPFAVGLVLAAVQLAAPVAELLAAGLPLAHAAPVAELLAASQLTTGSCCQTPRCRFCT